ncbi:MAG: Rv3235 family protein [Microlunatus sp.]
MSVSVQADPRYGSALLRPATDCRPPAEQWVGIGPHQVAPPDQPRLQLIEGSKEGDPDLFLRAPTRAAVPITVDLTPAGVATAQAAGLAEQARTWAPWFAQLLAETIDGRRPLESLGRWLDEWALAEVGRHARLQRRERARRQTGSPVPLATVASLRTQFTHRRVLEVAVHVRRGRRSSAWAFQLICVGDRWRCTAVVLGPAIV